MEKSRFRGIDPILLRQVSQHPYWFVPESTKQIYSYPLKWSRFKNLIQHWRLRRLAGGFVLENLFRVGILPAAYNPSAHQGPFLHAIDFLVPRGTVILSPASGEIVELQDCHEPWDWRRGAHYLVNFLTIKHESGEFSHLGHIAKGSVSRLGLTVGSRVKRGQPIGLVGSTGWKNHDHMHFAVFRFDTHPPNPLIFNTQRKTFKSLEVIFSGV